MAEPAVSPELLVTLTAALENLRTACRLPSGWKAVPSFRLTEKGASLLVVWRPALASAAQKTKTKNKRRSPSSVRRSADRAAAHKTRKGQQSAPPQQQLRRSAPVFNMPIPPTPNSVPAAGQPAAEESERVGGRIEGQSLPGPLIVEDRMVGLSGPTELADAAGRGVKRVAVADERAEVRRLCEGLFERWSNGREESQHAFSLRDQLDRLRGPGTTRSLHGDWTEDQARKSRQS